MTALKELLFDFLSTAGNEHKYQKVLQVIENDRARIPNLRNRNKHSEIWFLSII